MAPKAVMGLVLLFFTGTCVGCARSEPPGARSVEATPQPVGAVADGGDSAPRESSVQLTKLNDAGAGVQPVFAQQHAAVAAAPDVTTENDSLLDADGQPSPQTDEKPAALDPKFKARISLLCEAIIDGKPDEAHSVFFPLVAYRQVKAIADPDRDYQLRLIRHFDRDILEYHRRVTKRLGNVNCSGISVPESQARWMKPGSEYNRIGYFRVLRSQLGFTDASGNTLSLEVTSLISWRGQWYVVHLNGFE